MEKETELCKSKWGQVNPGRNNCFWTSSSLYNWSTTGLRSKQIQRMTEQHHFLSKQIIFVVCAQWSQVRMPAGSSALNCAVTECTAWLDQDDKYEWLKTECQVTTQPQRIKDAWQLDFAMGSLWILVGGIRVCENWALLWMFCWIFTFPEWSVPNLLNNKF